MSNPYQSPFGPLDEGQSASERPSTPEVIADVAAGASSDAPMLPTIPIEPLVPLSSSSTEITIPIPSSDGVPTPTATPDPLSASQTSESDGHPSESSRRGWTVKGLFSTIKEKVQEPSGPSAPVGKFYYDSINMFQGLHDLSDSSDEEDEGVSPRSDASRSDEDPIKDVLSDIPVRIDSAGSSRPRSRLRGEVTAQHGGKSRDERESRSGSISSVGSHSGYGRPHRGSTGARSGNGLDVLPEDELSPHSGTSSAVTSPPRRLANPYRPEVAPDATEGTGEQNTGNRPRHENEIELPPLSFSMSDSSLETGRVLPGTGASQLLAVPAMNSGISSHSSTPGPWEENEEWRGELVPLALESDENALASGISEEELEYTRRERRRQVSRSQAANMKWYHRVWKQVRRQVRRQQTWVFLLVLGLVAAVTGLAMEESMHLLISGRNKLASLTTNYFVNYMSWVAFGMASCTLAAALVEFVGPYSAGSGIPAVKSILSGVLLEHYLSFRTLITKIVGLICVYAAGLFVGKEGPYVHISTALASQLARLPFFEKIRRNEGLKLQLFAAGCAAGVAVTFGAPIGGVIFSIEVTTTYYLIQNLSKGFFCAIVATLFVHLLDTHGLIAFFSTDFAPAPYTSAELVAFSLIGISFGLLGVLFNLFVKKLAQLRRNYKIFNQSRYGQVLLVAMISGLVTFPIIPLRNGPTAVLNDLFSTAPLQHWQNPNVYFVLCAVVVLEFVMCGISIGLPVPCGLYTPMFILGAALGRLIGEVLQAMHILPGLVPAGYAVVGAAAFAAGTTRTLSSSIICFELTRQLEHLLPVLLAVLIASAVGNFFGPSIYEELLKMKGLPYMPPFKSSQSGNKTARAIMRRDVQFLTTDSTYEDIQNLLIRSHYSTFPLVQSNKQRTLLGILSRDILEKQLDKLESRLSSLAHRQVEILNLALQDSVGLTPPPIASSADGASVDAASSTATTPAEGGDGDKETVSTPKEPKPIEPNFKSRFGGLYASLHLEPDSRDAQTSPESQKLQDVMHTLTQQAMNESVGFSRKTPGLDAGPFQLPVQTPHSKVHFLFAMLGLKCGYIVDQGELVGVITKRDLISLQ